MKVSKSVIITICFLCVIISFRFLYVMQENMDGVIPKHIKGIRRRDIQPNNRDLYILKSQVIPPVCPKCPNIVNVNKCNENKKVPPCPPCGRCPESSFECKKVPIYSQFNTSIVRPFMNNVPMS